MRGIAIVLVLSYLFVGCATTMPDRIIKLEAFDLRGKKVVIIPFEIDSAIVSEVNLEFANELGNEIALDLRSLLYQKGYKNITVDGGELYGDYLIRGKITEVSGGNKHQRVWLGFGYGGTVVAVRGEIYDRSMNKTVFDFNITKQSNWTYSDNEAAVRENIHEIAKEIIASAIEKK